MHKKYHLHSFVSFSSLLVVAGCLLASSPAMAGFQWIPPEDQIGGNTPPSVEVPSPQAMELPPIDGSGGPVVITGKAPVSKPVDDKAVQGFADNIPLTVALRQVLPPEVGFSVSPDVGVDTMVSWKGGSSWRKVMKDMLDPAGLAYKEQGALVSISRVGLGHSTIAEKGPISPAVMAAPPSSPSSDKPMALVPPSKGGKDIAPMPLEDRTAQSGRGGLLVPPSSAEVHAPMSLPVASGAASSQPGMTDTWVAEKGMTLQKVLADWCQRANVDMNWQAEYDFPLQATVTFSTTFEEAVRALLGGFQDAKPQPAGYLYNNQVAGQTVLLIQVRGNNYNE